MEGIFAQLTKGLGDVAANAEGTFEAGPLGQIRGVLNQFGLDFSDCITEFTEYYEIFKADLLLGTQDQQDLFNLRPMTLKFPSLLQLGSKRASDQYSPQLRGKLYDKLAEAFPSATFNGVKIPNLPLGQSFSETFPNRGEFPGEIFYDGILHVTIDPFLTLFSVAQLNCFGHTLLLHLVMLLPFQI
jgi:hypothetical protein